MRKVMNGIMWFIKNALIFVLKVTLGTIAGFGVGIVLGFTITFLCAVAMFIFTGDFTFDNGPSLVFNIIHRICLGIGFFFIPFYKPLWETIVDWLLTDWY